MEQPQTLDQVRELLEELEWRREAVRALEGTIELIKRIILSDEEDQTKVTHIKLLLVE